MTITDETIAGLENARARARAESANVTVPTPARLTDVGLSDVEADAVINLIGTRRRAEAEAESLAGYIATLDTPLLIELVEAGYLAAEEVTDGRREAISEHRRARIEADAERAALERLDPDVGVVAILDGIDDLEAIVAELGIDIIAEDIGPASEPVAYHDGSLFVRGVETSEVTRVVLELRARAA